MEVKVKKTLIILLLVCCVALVYAQKPDIFQGFNTHYSLPSILDPAKLKISNSASFSAGSSSSGLGFYQSVYTNHIKYDFSPKVQMKVDLNFVNYGTASHQNWNIKANPDNQSAVLPNISFQYKPSDNTHLYLQFPNRIRVQFS